MIYQPRNLQILKTSLDGLKENQLQYQIATNNKIIAYELFIYDLNNNIFYDSGKIKLTPNLYNNDILTILLPSSIKLVNGMNYRYSIRLWQDFLDIEVSKGKVQSISSQTKFKIVANVNIKAGMYIGIQKEAKQITDYNSVSGEVTIESAYSSNITEGTDYSIVSDFIDQFPEENLYVRNYPQIYMTNVQTMTTKSYTFKGIYIQQQNVPIVSYTFNIYHNIGDLDEKRLLMSYTNKSANIECYYDGFLNGQDYLIELIVLNEYNIEAKTDLMPFTAEYETPPYLEKPQIEYVKSRNANKIQFQADIMLPVSTQYQGIVKGNILSKRNDTYFMVNQNLNIEEGDTIIIERYNKATVLDYNSASGHLVTSPFIIPLNVNDSFYINKKVQLGENGLNILTDIPYRRVNSADLNASLVYDGNIVPQGILNDFPKEFQFTTQLKFREDFITQIHNSKYEYTNIIDVNCDNFDCIGLKLGIRKRDLITLIPTKNEYDRLTNGKQSNTTIYITNEIDFSKQQFIIFRDYNNYVAEIKAYDDNLKKVRLVKPLPFTPEKGAYIYVPFSIVTPFIAGVKDVWLLQEFENALEHTYWEDMASWDDDKYWRETGDFISLISSIWWKIQVRSNSEGNSVKIEQGGV